MSAPVGKRLNSEWKVGAQHALFSRAGSWYHLLERFPAALFDENGYLLFANEHQYKNSTHLKIGQELNVPGGIASVPGYVRVR
jgi:hypothetical protein